MKTKPILFSTPMIIAILNGSKTQTRHKVKSSTGIYNIHMKHDGTPYEVEEADEDFGDTGKKILPKFWQGDIMWVRETWQITDFLHPSDENYGYIYKASHNGREWEANVEEWKWRPSIFMPKDACRLFIEVSNVRIERLTDISEEDALAEGIELIEHNCFKNYMQGKGWMYKGRNQNGYGMVEDPVGSFASLWELINGEGSWSKKKRMGFRL